MITPGSNVSDICIVSVTLTVDSRMYSPAGILTSPMPIPIAVLNADIVAAPKFEYGSAWRI
ncbi:hypothetical protein AZZ62_004978 [Klebsiella variicola]|nr:hypothetical protein AZZ62_004978 [Klebsiella variicola]